MEEYNELGHEKCSKMILDRLGDNPIYVTFDLDCLDATVAPGVANIESAFNGFNMDEARKLIQSLKGKNVIGGDVACLMPTKDNPIYITFDLDCLDATVAPGVANIESAFRGFNMDEARKLIQSLKGKNVIGGDVACLMPTKDNPNQITSMVASSIMFEIICLISLNLNK